MRRVMFTGSRDWADAAAVREVVDALPLDALVIVGDCPTGVDHIVRVRCIERGLRFEKYLADWHMHGHAAGPLRNQAMVLRGKPTEAYAFPRGLSRGTRDAIRRLQIAGIPVTIREGA